MRPWIWAWNAGLRTVRGVHPRFALPDDAWARRRLPAVERALFEQMDPRERDHGIRVAKRVLERRPTAPDEVVRAALLHDVGKSRRPYRVVERILLHAPLGPPPQQEPELHGWQGARQVAVHHPSYGAAMIRAAGGSSRVAQLVALHEAPGEDLFAAWIHEADRRT